ncbi:MAG: hypoxanthine phosphoribosyltransferase [Endomicrobium sp.]|jgi:hypoxanthine phosphoribosyltransferase|nr:hypoxanthine phosphoribosyltransferase [Endomicrobium sp.]
MKMNADIDVLFTRELIQERVRQTARRISEDFKGRKVLLIAVLRGSFVFCSDLIRELTIEFKVDFISLSSYSGAVSSGNIKVMSELREDPAGEDVIIVEDIIDTGITLDFLLKELSLKNPKSVSACALLNKKGARIKDVAVKYSCFEIGGQFVVGYGLDYNGLYRGLPYIAILKIK